MVSKVLTGPADVPEEHPVAGHAGAHLVVSGVVIKLAGYHSNILKC